MALILNVKSYKPKTKGVLIMSENVGKKTTFWSFLKEKKVIIPIIQRDYAQGRADENAIAERFVEDLKSALDGSADSLVLDFVYGSNKDKNVFLPLDGQQRLTTLWLLHWYIAFRSSNALAEDDLKTFKNFSYETRSSSREFLEKLNDLLKDKETIKSNLTNDGLRNKIEEYSWFLKSWMEDQTVSAMLNMLERIEKVFKDPDHDVNTEKINEYWKKIQSENAPIVFYSLTLENFGLTDDLYIKMNARGKPLTNFENFKADLVSFLEHRNGTVADRISRKLDTTWTDLFWKNRSADKGVDEIYFAFLNRWFLNEWVAKGSVSADAFDKGDCLQSELYGILRKNEGGELKKEVNDAKICYKKFDIYREILELKPEMILELESILDNIKQSLDDGFDLFVNKQNIFYPHWNKNSKFRFIPTYDGNEEIEDYGKRKIRKILTIDQMERPIFYAICKYFENGKYESISFSRWMRFVWNLVSDPRLRDSNAMIQAIRKIKDYSKYTRNIYEQLAVEPVAPANTALLEQLNEERVKAKQICVSENFEQNIIAAEKIAFFGGQIRFLYQNADGETDWSVFERKVERSKELFDERGLKDIKFISVFISCFTQKEQITGKLPISKTVSCWKEIMISKNALYKVPLHDFLLNTIEPISIENFTSKIECNESDLFVQQIQKDLLNTELISAICKFDQDKKYPCVHYDRKTKYVLISPNKAKADEKKFYLGVKRNVILSELYCGKNEESLRKGKIISSQKVDGSDCNYFWGKDVKFTYLTDSQSWRLVWSDNGEIIANDVDRKLNEDEINCDDASDFMQEVCKRLESKE